MSLPVHLVDSLDGVAVGDRVEVGGDEAHHAVAVRRLREGEGVELTDGRGTSVRGRVVATAKRSLVVQADEVARVPVPQPVLTVVQAVPKGDRGELAVEVLTEVGAGQVVAWNADRCQLPWRGERGDKALARWRSTAREAAKQARRAHHPRVTGPVDLAGAVARVAAADLAVVLHEEAGTALAELAVPTTGEVVVVVGPEGGLTPDELEALRGAGGHVVRLGDEVLRTSTAGLAAAAALLSRTPRWRAPGS